jgi:hypothetical protein
MSRATVRVLYHLNGVTKVALENSYTPGPSALDIPTSVIPEDLRQIGARFLLATEPTIVVEPLPGLAKIG